MSTIEKKHKLTAFETELTVLINKYSLENLCDIPDFLMARMLRQTLEHVLSTTKDILDWHGTDSICHPINLSRNIDSN